MDVLGIVLFYLLGITLISSSICILFLKKTYYCLISALLMFLSVGGLYFVLNAEFNAVIQFLISVLLLIFLFYLSLFFNNKEKGIKTYLNIKTILSFIFVLLFLGLIFIALINNYLEQNSNTIVILATPNKSLSSIYTFAENLVFNYMPSFLAIGICLLVIIINLCSFKAKSKGDE